MQLSRYVTTFPCPDKPGRVLLLATRRYAVLALGLLKRIATELKRSAQEHKIIRQDLEIAPLPS